jgi:hypothetical protein
MANLADAFALELRGAPISSKKTKNKGRPDGT